MKQGSETVSVAKKQITVRISNSGFHAKESFTSESDADAWRTMVESTLKHRERATFDLTVYAAGLASTVRECGGTYTMDKWLNIEVPQEQWAKGLPVPIDYEAMRSPQVMRLELLAPRLP